MSGWRTRATLENTPVINDDSCYSHFRLSVLWLTDGWSKRVLEVGDGILFNSFDLIIASHVEEHEGIHGLWRGHYES